MLECTEAAFQVIDYGSWCIGVAAVGPDSRAKMDVMVYYAGFGVRCVCEVGFLLWSEHVSACWLKRDGACAGLKSSSTHGTNHSTVDQA